MRKRLLEGKGSSKKLLKSEEKTLIVESPKKQRGSMKPEKVRKLTHQCGSAFCRLLGGIGARKMVP